MVYRVYVEKKDGFQHEANSLLAEVRDLLEIKGVENIRVINRYDVEDIEKSLFDYACKTVFSEPQMDTATDTVDLSGAKVFAVEYLPGQFDQRADSASQCIQLISQKERPTVKTAKVYAVYGDVSDGDLTAIKKFVINPVESREAELKEYQTLKIEQPVPKQVETLDGFIDLDRAGLEKFVSDYSLAMDGDDIEFCQKYFIKENTLR